MDDTLRIQAFDLENKDIRDLSAEDILTAQAQGAYVWIDGGMLDALPLDLPPSLRQALQPSQNKPHPGYRRLKDGLHLTLVEPLNGGSADTAQWQRLDIWISKQHLLTLHQGPSPLIEAMRPDLAEDFRLHARSPSFLIYELFDHWLEAVNAAQVDYSQAVLQLQAELMEDFEDETLDDLSNLGARLLEFRGILLPSRAMLAELASRRSDLISTPTREALDSIRLNVDRLLADSLADREILNTSLNLHMSLTAHRTNQAVKRLTAVSMIFLPLSFLAGVYGMNFEHMPELGLRWAYAGFWLSSGLLALLLILILRRLKML